jgi:large subunit ribosomal protein L21
MYAIVATGGKQIKVAAGDVVTVEKLDASVGESVTFDVIFLADGEEITVDPTVLASAKVTGEVVDQFKGEKAVIFKFKKRKGYKRLKGHRQNLTKVLITGVIGSSDEVPAKKPTPAKASAEKAPAKKAAAAKAPAAEATAEKAPAKKAPAKKAPAKKAAPKAEKVADDAVEKKTTSRAKKAKASEETDASAPAAEQE